MKRSWSGYEMIPNRCERINKRNGEKIKEKMEMNKVTEQLLHDYIVLHVRRAAFKDFYDRNIIFLEGHDKESFCTMVHQNHSLQYWYCKETNFFAMANVLMDKVNTTLRKERMHVTNFHWDTTEPYTYLTKISGCTIKFQLQLPLYKFKMLSKMAILFARLMNDFRERKYGPKSEEFEKCKQRFNKLKKTKVENNQEKSN